MKSELQQEFDRFCRAMTMRFSNYTDFAQPTAFWKKYRQSKPNRPKRPKRRRLNEEGGDDTLDYSSSSSYGGSGSDDELPLDRHKMTISSSGSVANRGSYDVLATELIFQPQT